jgi:UMF1 family MFS transporter
VRGLAHAKYVGRVAIRNSFGPSFLFLRRRPRGHYFQPMSSDRREIFAWTIYDWANSAFSTTVITVLSGPYLTALAQRAVGDNGTLWRIGPIAVTAKSFFPYCISFSVALQVLLLPVLGAIADYTHLKKRVMAVACYIGAVATCLMFFTGGPLFAFGGLLLIVANVSFGASVVVYNAYLNDIVADDQRDVVSARGYALGYLGGGLLLALNLVLMKSAARIGISTDAAVRLSLMSAGLWWGGFSIVTFAWLKPRGRPRTLPEGRSYVRVGFAGLAATFRELTMLPQTLRYLIAYMLYNDGIQTVITVSSVFLAQELFVARGLPADESFLVLLILVVQFVAFGGAIVFARIARLAGTKNAILLSLVLWTGVVVYAYGFLQTTAQAWGLGIAIAIVLGGSQALSRSLYSQMIPAGREASFFSIYEISERGTSWIGPLLFGFVVATTNSYRQAILSLIVLFIAGTAMLVLTDTDQAIADRHRADAAGEAT